MKKVMSRVHTGGVRRSLKRGKDDWTFFCQNDYIPVLRKTAKEVSDESLEERVSFIFVPSTRQIMATGWKQIRRENSDVVDFPKYGGRRAKNV